MIKIHPFTTGYVRIRPSQIYSDLQKGAVEILFDNRWSDWLPITAWLIEHPTEGLVLVDTGETARAMQPGYFPRFHPYYRRAVEFNVQPEDEIGPQLRKAGYRPADVRHVLLTHLHTDHAGGLHHFPQSTIWVHSLEWQAAKGMGGWINGYLKKRWPAWLEPRFFPMLDGPFGGFTNHTDFFSDGSIRILPTPGHSIGHVSVAVDRPNQPIVLAGDASYTTTNMVSGQGGAGLAPEGYDSLTRLRSFVQASHALYLPAHEPGAAEKLLQQDPLPGRELRNAPEVARETAFSGF
jgi:glyoxylase-like metal-dependent hydrolase (beta-lactamase superfamily II)